MMSTIITQDSTAAMAVQEILAQKLLAHLDCDGRHAKVQSTTPFSHQLHSKSSTTTNL